MYREILECYAKENQGVKIQPPAQMQEIDKAQEYVKNGHYLAYITCSLTRDENELQTEHFLKKHPRFLLVKEKRYSPYLTNTDGFYLSVMQKR